MSSQEVRKKVIHAPKHNTIHPLVGNWKGVSASFWIKLSIILCSSPSFFFFFLQFIICSSHRITPIKMSFKVADTETPVDPDTKPIIIMHGLLGSKNNWNSLAKAIHRKTKKKVSRNKWNNPESIILVSLPTYYYYYFLKGLTQGTVTDMVLSSRNQSEKEDRIGKRLFQDWTLRLEVKIHHLWELNPWPSAFKVDMLPTKLTRLAIAFSVLYLFLSKLVG